MKKGTTKRPSLFIYNFAGDHWSPVFCYFSISSVKAFLSEEPK